MWLTIILFGGLALLYLKSFAYGRQLLKHLILAGYMAFLAFICVPEWKIVLYIIYGVMALIKVIYWIYKGWVYYDIVSFINRQKAETLNAEQRKRMGEEEKK